MTLEELARHLGEAANVILPAIYRRIANEVGEDAAERARNKLGSYQSGIGPFPTWPLLEDATIEEKIRQGWPTPSPLLRTAELQESIDYRTDIQTTSFTIELYSTSEYAPAHELGSDHVPARPFLGPVFWEQEKKYSRMIGNSIIDGIIPGIHTFGGGAISVAATMGGKGESLSSSSGIWRSARSAGQKMGMWKSLRGIR